MRILTVRQPWAHLIINGYVDPWGFPAWKDVENRSGRTNWRGPLVIHAAKVMDMGRDVPEGLDFRGLVFGAALGTVVLDDCLRLADAPDSQWANGPWCWMLRDRQPFSAPVPCRGYQGLWTPSDEVRARISAAIRDAGRERVA